MNDRLFESFVRELDDRLEREQGARRRRRENRRRKRLNKKTQKGNKK